MGWKNDNIKNKSIFIILLFTLLIIFSSSFLFFPNHIKLIKNENNKINFNLSINKEQPNKLDYIAVNNNISNNVDIKQDTVLNTSVPAKNVNINSLKNLKNMKVVPIGKTVGICINTEGVMVLGTGYVNSSEGKTCKPCEGLLESGDLILKANDKELKNKEHLLKIIEDSPNNIHLILKRNSELLEVDVKPIKSLEDNVNRIGLWVRDSTQGIGTITYYNPMNNKFGALGHSILDVDTKKIISVNNGMVMKSEISSIVKGEKGAPGELVGNIKKEEILGEIKSNTKFGIYGYLNKNDEEYLNKEAISIGLQSEVVEGPAKILSNIEGSEVKEYDILIESVNKFNSDDSKGMVIRITDKELLSKTNGIVQGMSGSPIIQSNKLIGAVTHVFVQEPSKGYGIFIENMLSQDKNI